MYSIQNIHIQLKQKSKVENIFLLNFTDLGSLKITIIGAVILGASNKDFCDTFYTGDDFNIFHLKFETINLFVMVYMFSH